ncbi:hypothetical protein F2Q69_00034430 [Brassica cretica]|uniref:Cystatin domain-containing protein n=1 Tax=Brassica cretica TaxID=69181 RepID=A0A8S9SKQ7_BRACR|nr:hypothetical protein F2Q69_00034430 [Brassica cretica]
MPHGICSVGEAAIAETPPSTILDAYPSLHWPQGLLYLHQGRALLSQFQLQACHHLDVSARNIREVAKYAIDEHNSESDDNLVFVKIIEGKWQVRSAILIYDLTIAAKNEGGATKNYKTVVMESGRDKILYSFNEL